MKQSAIDSYIRQIIRARGLTLQGLSTLLGYKSATSLARIMQETANRESLVKFANRLRSCPSLTLSKQEATRLDDLIELHDIGLDDYGAMLSLRRMIRGEPAAAPGKLMLQTPDGGQQSFLAHFSGYSPQRILLLNSEQVPMYSDLIMLMQWSSVSVEHYLYTGTSNMHSVHSLHATLPLLYLSGYHSYSYTLDFDPFLSTRGLITSDILLIDYHDAAGHSGSEMIIFTAPCEGKVLPSPISIDTFRQLLPPIEDMHPISTPVPHTDLISYAAFCLELEHDHSVYRLKPDVGIEQIPVEILMKAISDEAPPEIQHALPRLRGIFTEHYQNMLTKPNPQYHIMKRRDMWRFVQTGRMSDHLWCCRAFTPSERVEILQFLLDLMVDHRNFHLYFLKDDDALRDEEIVLYEGRGLSIFKPGSDYSLIDSANHAEVLITQPEFLSVFKRFYVESTLRYRVEPQDVAVQELRAMINYCQHLT